MTSAGDEYLLDARGSVIAVVDATASLVGQYDYDAFGNIRGSTDDLPAHGDLRMHGMWMDASGLYVTVRDVRVA